MFLNKKATVALFLCALWIFAQSDNTAREKLIASLNAQANVQFAERAQSVAKIQTRADAEKRKELVRRKILDLIGGLPAHPSSVTAKQFGTLSGDGFRIEKLAYESLPGFWVTANLYVPANDSGPFPAVLLAPGHEATGKQNQYSWGVNLARNGIVAMAIDPLGQGERLQYFDPERKASAIGGSTGEHGEANIPAMLIGENIARYSINDSMRGIDYLLSRKDVDANRIGAFGCSGGGTSTAYLAALDDHLKAVGVACYITSFQELLSSATGVQEAEQSIPHFIEQGLDFGDWVEAFAPKPYAIISTTSDMFPFEGARHTYEEAKRIYGIYGSGANLQWITGPGGHGNLGPISPAILGFFLHHLKGTLAGDAAFTAERPQRPEDLLVTPTGQVSTSVGGETVASIVRAHAPDLPSKPASPQDIRELTGATAGAVAIPESDALWRGVVPFKMIEPGGSGRKPAILLLDSPEHAAPELDRMAKSGWVVAALQPTPTPPGTEGLKSPYLGSLNLLSLRAFLVGKTIVGLQIDDAIHAVDSLAARTDVDPSRIAIYGNGPLGIVALHTAALDSRIRSVVVENTLASYRMVLDQPLHRNISEVMIPGVLRKYDVGNLVLAIAPSPVTIINPQDATGAVISKEQFQSAAGYVFQTKGQAVRVLARKTGETLPFE
jgi:cephalosporin-C deacetylase-like acetyl esterase